LWRHLRLFAISVVFLYPLFAQTGAPDVAAISSAIREKQFDRALALLHTQLQQSPRDPRLWTLQGIAFSGKGMKKEALASFRKALMISPEFLSALEGAAQLEYEAGSDAAVPLLERVLRVHPKDPTSHAMLAVIAYRHRECQTSVQHFDQSGPLLDTQPSALQEYGVCLVKLKRLDQAISAFQRLVRSDPDDGRARYQLAVVQLMAGHPQDTIATLNPLLQKEPTDDRSLELAASAYEANGDTPQAVSTLRQAIVKSPKNVDLYLDFADLSMQHQSFQVGIDMIDAGLTLLTQAASLYVARGVLYVQLAQYEKAEADFEKADALDPGQSISAAALGLAAVQKNDLDHALTTVQSKLKKKPGDPYLLYLEASILSQKGSDPGSVDFETALRSVKAAVATQPSLLSARDLLAKLYLQNGQNQLAVEQCRKALEIDPKDQTALYHLIQALRKTGDRAELPTLLQRLAQLRQQATQEERQHNRYKLVEEPEPMENAPKQ
jgi:tetratricopeptide (TPR) repeat protein